MTDDSKRSELSRAAEYGRVGDVGRLLLSGICSLDCRDRGSRSALHWAARRGQAGVVGLLIEAQAQLDGQDHRGWTALHEAAVQNHMESVRLLTRGAADVNRQETGGNSPLHLAAECGHMECVQWLLRARADADLKARSGHAATHCAAQHGHTEALRLLLAECADPSIRANAGETPLHLAAQNGHSDAISVLLSAGADPNALTDVQYSPLHLAAMTGHKTAVQLLLHAGSNVLLQDAAGLSAAAVACCFGCADILTLMLRQSLNGCQADERIDRCCLSDQLLLPGSTEGTLQNIVQSLDSGDTAINSQSTELAILDEQVLSTLLHSALRDAGFVQCRAAVQSALADVLQDILRRRFDDRMHLVGSYSDGWGNSLVTMNGVTDRDSDIDEIQILPERVLHLKQFCQCKAAPRDDIVDYKCGHVLCSGSASTPAQAFDGSYMRPAVDLITAYRCCAYPRIEVLQPGHRSHISPSVRDSLRQELLTSPCHAVSAAPPGEEGQKLRISTSFLERALMRSLNDIQGQVFIILKHLMKKAPAAKVERSLRTYHAKTVMFYLLDETPADMWQPRNIMQLTRRGLEKLLDSLNAGSNPDKCMRHFFLRDACVYLKKGHCNKTAVVEAVTHMMRQLPRLILQFRDQLRPLGDDGAFRFHPFLILPSVMPRPVSESGKMPYHSVSDAVRSLLMKMSRSNQREELLRCIQRLPNSAATARRCLVALMHLKFDRKDAAMRVLSDSIRSEVSRGVPCPGHLESGQITRDVRQHIKSTDSAWKFCFWFEEEPLEVVEFLPQSISRYFPYQFLYLQMYYMNMQALHRCLCLHLGVADETCSQTWFSEVLNSEEPDVQELLMVLEFCRDKDLLVRLIHRHRRLICDTDEVCCKVEEMIAKDSDLRHLSISRTVEAALLQLQASKCHVTSAPDHALAESDHVPVATADAAAITTLPDSHSIQPLSATTDTTTASSTAPENNQPATHTQSQTVGTTARQAIILGMIALLIALIAVMLQCYWDK